MNPDVVLLLVLLVPLFALQLWARAAADIAYRDAWKRALAWEAGSAHGAGDAPRGAPEKALTR
jgi:hypothetical protein